MKTHLILILEKLPPHGIHCMCSSVTFCYCCQLCSVCLQQLQENHTEKNSGAAIFTDYLSALNHVPPNLPQQELSIIIR